MANPHKGEVELVSPSKTYTLKLGMGTLATLAAKSGLGVNDLMLALQDQARPDFLHLQILSLWAALQRYHRTMTIDDAADLMDEVGLPAVVQAFSTAAALAFPASQGGDGTGAGDPPKAEEPGTGPGSSAKE